MSERPDRPPFGAGMFSHDSKGHGETRTTKYPPGVLELLGQVMEKLPWLPYRSQADIIRDGLVRHLGELSELDPTLARDFNIIDVQNRHMARSKRQVWIDGVVDSFDKQFQFARDTEEVQEILAELKLVLASDLPGETCAQLRKLQQRWQ